MSLSEKETCLLGLLAETDEGTYGYEVERMIDERGMRYWTPIGFSSIYYILKRLHERSLVSVSEEQAETGLVRKRYRLTPDGIEALRNQTLRLLSHPTSIVDPICLGIMHLPFLSRDEAVDALTRYEEEITRQHLVIQQKRQEHLRDGVPAIVITLFDQSLALITCRKRIAADIREKLGTGEIPYGKNHE